MLQVNAGSLPYVRMVIGRHHNSTNRFTEFHRFLIRLIPHLKQQQQFVSMNTTMKADAFFIMRQVKQSGCKQDYYPKIF